MSSDVLIYLDETNGREETERDPHTRLITERDPFLILIPIRSVLVGNERAH